MAIQLEIPGTVADAMRIPPHDRPEQLRRELAGALYARGILSLGKARELAGMGVYEFGRFLAARGIARPYGEEELREDLAYARGE